MNKLHGKPKSAKPKVHVPASIKNLGKPTKPKSTSKKSTGSEVVVYKPSATKILPIEVIDDTVSSFEKRYKKLRKQLNLTSDDSFDNQTNIVLLRSLLFSVNSMIAIAEVQYKTYKNERAAYAWNTLVTQSLQIMNDLRMLQGSDHQVNRLVEMLQHGITLGVQHMIDNTYLLRKQLTEATTSDKVKRVIETKTEEFINSQGKSLNEVYKMVEHNIRDLFAVKR